MLHSSLWCFHWCVTEGITAYLKHLIQEHHKLFKDLHPPHNLIT